LENKFFLWDHASIINKYKHHIKYKVKQNKVKIRNKKLKKKFNKKRITILKNLKNNKMK